MWLAYVCGRIWSRKGMPSVNNIPPPPSTTLGENFLFTTKVNTATCKNPHMHITLTLNPHICIALTLNPHMRITLTLNPHIHIILTLNRHMHITLTLNRYMPIQVHL